MVRIDRVETIIVDIPTVREHVLAMATMRHQTMCLVRVDCSDGSIGIGEATTIGGVSYADESPEGIKLAIDAYLAPVILNMDADRPGTIMAALQRQIVGNRFAKSALETALLDALGHRRGMPVSELLGGRVRDRVPVVWTLASGDTGRDVQEAQDLVASGRHDAFKLKIGKRAIVDDVAHVAAIKRALGARASIRVDVNMAWSESEAARGIEMLADVGCDLVEQPILGSNIDGMARLRAKSRIAIMADEGLTGPATAYAHASRGACDVFAVKLEQSGGATAAKQVQAVAEAAGIGLYGGTMLEGGVGTIASAHLFATFRRLDFGTELFGPLLLTQELLTKSLDYSDCSLAVPTGPGLGIAIDPDALASFRRDRSTFVALAAAKG